MCPGATLSHSRGGFGYRHTATRFTPPAPGRQVFTPNPRALFGAPRQRFSIAPGENSTKITLDENESVTVSTDPKTGSVTVEIAPPKPEGGVEVEVEVGPVSRSAARRERMAISAAPDGTVEITPDLGQQLVVLGEPDSVLVVVGEVPAE